MILDITHGERLALLSALRRSIHHADKSRAGLLVKFGDEADLGKQDEWIGWLESAYVKVGGNLTALRNREAERV